MWRNRDRIVRGLARQRLLVFLDSGGVFDGLLLDADERTLTFADVRRRTEVGNEAAAAGELYVDRRQVLYVQRVAADQVM